MRVTILLFVSVLLMPAPVVAQDWAEYINRDDGFRVNCPGLLAVTETPFRSEYGVDLPARVHSVVRGLERYSITVVDYRQAPRLLDEKADATCPRTSRTNARAD